MFIICVTMRKNVRHFDFPLSVCYLKGLMIICTKDVSPRGSTLRWNIWYSFFFTKIFFSSIFMHFCWWIKLLYFTSLRKRKLSTSSLLIRLIRESFFLLQSIDIYLSLPNTFSPFLCISVCNANCFILHFLEKESFQHPPYNTTNSGIFFNCNSLIFIYLYQILVFIIFMHFC